jgi:RNase H-fold protein (predicted Holliday junction resolvase)
MQNTLGISLGTRLMGTAILYDGELNDFRVRTFYRAWNAKKRSAMIETIRKTVERYGITRIAVKTPKPAHCTQRINELVADIRALSERLHVKLCICTISCLKKQYKGNPMENKQELVQFIIRKYPNYRQLAHLSTKERSNRSAYHVKLFEAIACAEMALRTGQ